jgi:hypothetical protein
MSGRTAPSLCAASPAYAEKPTDPQTELIVNLAVITASVDRCHFEITIRCAIYTRKSSDEGLEQEFNSLDAQWEGCEAYIVSQRHAGWIALSDMYDDGGLSGGTMALKQSKYLK